MGFDFYYWLEIFLYMAVFVFTVVLTKRRLNDIEHSGWLSLFLLLPVINVVFFLALFLIPGTQGTNLFGPMPEKNVLSAVIVGCLLPLAVFAILVFALWQPHL